MRSAASFIMALGSLFIKSSIAISGPSAQDTAKDAFEDDWEDEHVLDSKAEDSHDSALVGLGIDAILIDDKTGGNGNGLIEPGETINITVVAKNSSFGELSGLRGLAQISSGSGVRFKSSTLTYDPIPRNGTAPSKEPAVLLVDKEAECGSRFAASFTLIAGGSSVSVSRPYQICK